MIFTGFMARGLFSTLVANYKLDGGVFWTLFFGLMLVCIVVPYLLGSLNFAIIISKAKYNEDIRTKGSGNGGMTNMLRTYGKKTGAATLVCDMLKSIVSVTIGCALMGITFGGYLAGFFCMLGHMFPIYYRFKGGKGVAVVAAMVLVLNPVVFFFLLIIFAVIVISTKYVSLASVMSVLMFPIILNRIDLIMSDYLLVYQGVWTGADTLIAILIAIFVVFMHRGNIKRLMDGTENKISFGKKRKSDAESLKKDGDTEK